jgi:prepilin-type N-terminal cleavage/methylation domain-containing protein
MKRSGSATSARNAFSLVELSIVLVILGLLTGGILAGQSLIRASEMRAVTNEYMRYSTALGTFKDKYFAIPGDFNNAQAFWGTAAACPGISTTATGGTCNGDGNGQISTSAATANEVFRAWQELALAGLIEGSYSGTSGDTTATDSYVIFGTNVPKSRMANAGWGILYLGPVAVSSATWFDGTFSNVLFFGSGNNANSLPTAAVLKPEEAWNIDTKVDDGKPATGAVVSLEAQAGTSSTTGCSDTASSTTATMAASSYSLGNSSVACSLLIKTSF